MMWMVGASLIGWLLLLAQPWWPWRMRERLVPATTSAAGLTNGTTSLGDITVLIPARDEAECLARTLDGLAAQGTFAGVVLVDDQSTDGTGDIARAHGLGNLVVVQGKRPPPGMSGKLWALTQGLEHVKTDRVLLLDADIELLPGMVAALSAKQASEGLGLVSLMVHLSMQRPWERLLIPAFIYFFKLLYPFALANSRHRFFAAAAGGCILTTREVLDRIGGFESLRGALIDDCTLARHIKRAGYRTFVGVTLGARSSRPYRGLGEIWNMVARTAFTQLRYSWWLLMICTALMLLYFAVPTTGLVYGVFRDAPRIAVLGLAAFAVMSISYIPTLRFYGIPAWQVVLLPLAGLLYLGMTWTSAIRYARGERSRWKARTYAREAQLSLRTSKSSERSS